MSFGRKTFKTKIFRLTKASVPANELYIGYNNIISLLTQRYSTSNCLSQTPCTKFNAPMTFLRFPSVRLKKRFVVRFENGFKNLTTLSVFSESSSFRK